MSALFCSAVAATNYSRVNEGLPHRIGNAQPLKTRGPHDRQGHEVVTLNVQSCFPAAFRCARTPTACHLKAGETYSRDSGASTPWTDKFAPSSGTWPRQPGAVNSSYYRHTAASRINGSEARRH